MPPKTINEVIQPRFSNTSRHITQFSFYRPFYGGRIATPHFVIPTVPMPCACCSNYCPHGTPVCSLSHRDQETDSTVFGPPHSSPHWNQPAHICSLSFGGWKPRRSRAYEHQFPRRHSRPAHKKRTAAVQAAVLYDLIQSELCFARLLLTGFYGDALLLHFLFCNQILNCFFGAHQLFHGHGFII